MTEPQRPNPDALLAAIQSETAKHSRGRLKVFLGMCPGVGKTFAMLEAAQRELRACRDVVIGYVETHGRKETDALTQGLTVIPRQILDYRGVKFEEMDLDAVLARKPQVALVDELAHTNIPGSRHPKRYHDVLELLDTGIDVMTTLNVQHVESRADTVRQITGTEIRETVSDRILDDAVIELVDLPPAELVQRLREGKVYMADRAAAAAQNFFKEANLTALRELALRLVADHVGVDTREYRQAATTTPWKTGHCLLVAVGSSPLSEELIRWTRRMADSLHCRWLAVHLESSRALSETAQAQLEKNLATARELGAEVFTSSDDDLVRGLLRVAREQNVTQIVVGKPSGVGWWEWWRGGRLLRRLARESGDIDLHIVRSQKASGPSGGRRWIPPVVSSFQQYLVAIGAVAATGFVNLGLMELAGPRVPGLAFLLVVVLLALKVGRGPVLAAGALSALAWDYFFLPPRFTLIIAKVEDGFLFGLYFVVAIVLGQLVARIRAQEQAERRREERAVSLYELNRDLAEASSRDEVVWQLVSQVSRVFKGQVAVAMFMNDKLAAHPDGSFLLTEKELGVANWAFKQRKSAGRFTDNLPGAEALHLPLATERKAFGVLAVKFPEKQLTLAQRDLVESFSRQAALVLDRIDLRAAENEARLLAESEKFSRTLLNSISHELRTPLAASTGAAAALAGSDSMKPEQRQLISEIQEANTRLNRVVGNLMDVARLESSKILPRLDWHDARDLVQTTLRELERELAGHPVTLEMPPSPMLVRLDFSLMHHALANLLLNAASHTPPGTPVTVQARMEQGQLVLSVADRGPGIPAEWLPRIFDKFFRAPSGATGGSGLGLTIVKGFIEAHHGTVTAENRPGGGAQFVLHLPQPEKAPALESAAA